MKRKYIALIGIVAALSMIFAGLADSADGAETRGGYTVTARYEFSGNRLVVREGSDGWYYHRLCDADDGNRAFLRVRLYEEPSERRLSRGDGLCWALPGKWLGPIAYQTKTCEYLPYGGHICSAWKGFRE